MHFVIIGGDAAGMSAASRAKRNSPDVEIAVLEQSQDVSYSACGMPYNIADPERKMEELVVRQAKVFKEKLGIDLRLGHKATWIDRQNKLVKGEDFSGQPFEIPYDKLLIATGASPVAPDLPGFDLDEVLVLKTLEHGRIIKDSLKEKEAKKAVIIGMGYIALEMAEAFRSRGIEVDMVKPRQRLLPWMPEKLSEVVKKELEDNQVNLYLGQEIKGIEKNNNGLQVLCSNTTLQADLVLVAIGVEPNSELASKAGLELGPKQSIGVDRCLLTSDPEIFSAGDCADAYHIVTGKRTWIPLALRANRAGRTVGDNVFGKKEELIGVAGTAVFKVFDLEVAKTGITFDEAKQAGFEPQEAIIESRSRAHAHPGSKTIWVQMIADSKSGRLLGAQMVGKEGVAHRINAPAIALQSKMGVEDFAQADLAYAPPFSPVWDPMLVAANQLLKKL